MKVFQIACAATLLHSTLGRTFPGSTSRRAFYPAAKVATTIEKAIVVTPGRDDYSAERPLVLQLRGGGALDKIQIAEAATVVSFVHGVLTYMAPQSTFELYSAHAPSPMAKMVMRRLGYVLACFGVLGYAALFSQDTLTVDQAIGLFWLGLACEFIFSIASKELKDMGAKPHVHMVYTVISGLLGAVVFSQKSRAMTQASVAFFMANSMVCASAPKMWRKLWQLPVKGSDDANSLLTDFGLWAFSLSIFAATLVFPQFDTDPLQAFTYSRIAILCRTLFMNLGTGMFRKLGMKTANQVFWLVYHALVVGALLVDGKTASINPTNGPTATTTKK